MKWLPLILEESLFLLYKQTADREKVKTLDGAWNLIARLVGVNRITHGEFSARRWAEGKETLQAYAAELENMAAGL